MISHMLAEMEGFDYLLARSAANKDLASLYQKLGPLA